MLVVYLNWVNSVAYQVPVSYVTPLTLAITTLGAIYQLALTLDAYRIKNNIQLLVLCICNVCFSIATIMQYGQIKAARDRVIVNHDMYGTPFTKNDWMFWEHASPALLTCMVVSCICSTAMCALTFGLSREFSWTLYQEVSPDRKMRGRYLVYQVRTLISSILMLMVDKTVQIYLVILKFTPFFIVAFIIVYDLIDVHYVEPEFSLTLAIIPAAIIHVGLAVYLVRIESYIGMLLVLVSLSITHIYIKNIQEN